MKRQLRWFPAAMILGLTACAGTLPATMPVGEPLAPTRTRGPCPGLAECAPILHDIVTSEWRIPPALAGRRLKATLLVDVKPDGFIRSVKLTRSSGNAAFDRSAVQAVENSQPFVELRGLPEVERQGGTQLQFVFVPR